MLPDAQKARQLGADRHPLFTYRAQEKLCDPLEKVWGHRHVNQVTGCYMANPSAVFDAMNGDGPYPVKAFFALGNNTVMSFANMNRIVSGLMQQELVVVQEHFMTPTAQLADYVLPGDSWHERPWLSDAFSWFGNVRPSEQSMAPMGEARSTFAFWKDLAAALGRPEIVPWDDIYAFYDWRLEGMGMTFRDFAAATDVHFEPPAYRKYEKTGFATPSGKVELASSILEELGFDPLPYFREDPAPDPDYPLTLFAGVREDGFFQTGHRHIPEMRARHPDPLMFIHPDTARDWHVAEGEWVEVANAIGAVRVRAEITDRMPPGLIRIPHGWWKPEMEGGIEGLSGARLYADAQLARDDDDYRDREQGIPHLKGVPCRINRINAGEEA